MKNVHYKNILTLVAIVSSLALASCKEDDPKKEDVPESITQVQLIFSREGADQIIVTATDPDGDGVLPLEVEDEIYLSPNADYILSIQLLNTIGIPTNEAYLLNAEIEEEGDEHMFFFGWTNNVFSNPEGNGNIDTRTDAVRYEGAANSIDEDGLPLGLTTTWTTAAEGTGTFRVILKHQPDLKSATSGSTVGETDLDVTFDIEIGE
jgi:hypothetical protein